MLIALLPGTRRNRRLTGFLDTVAAAVEVTLLARAYADRWHADAGFGLSGICRTLLS